MPHSQAFTEDDWKLVQLVLTLLRNILAIQDIPLQHKAGESMPVKFSPRETDSMRVDIPRMLVFLQLSLSRQPAFIGNFPLHVYGSRARVAWWSTSKSLQGWFILSLFFFFFFLSGDNRSMHLRGKKIEQKKRRKKLCRLLSLECLLDSISVADLMGNQFYFIFFFLLKSLDCWASSHLLLLSWVWFLFSQVI